MHKAAPAGTLIIYGYVAYSPTIRPGESFTAHALNGEDSSTDVLHLAIATYRMPLNTLEAIYRELTGDAGRYTLRLSRPASVCQFIA